MPDLIIKDVYYDELDDFIGVCIPPDRRASKAFVEGARLKRNWAENIIERYGSVGKIAYYGGVPVGIIQYIPIPEEKVYEVTCIFVTPKDYTRKGIGRSLFKAVLEDVEKPIKFFGGEKADALVTWAFEVPNTYPQNKFFIKMGFKQVYPDNPYHLYYPLKEGYVYTPREKHYIPQGEDCGQALVFINPDCPFCIYFMEKTVSLIREVSSDIPLRVINVFNESSEVSKRGKVPFCIVNSYPIEAFVMDIEGFKKEVEDAINKPCLALKEDAEIGGGHGV